MDQLHRATQGFVEAYGGELRVIGPTAVNLHNPTQFDLVVQCFGKRPHQTYGREPFRL